MIKKEELEQELMSRVHKKLTGNIKIELNQIHFEQLQIETGISVRKLKELFGIYKKRSEKTYEYSMSKLAQFIGLADWNAFVRQEAIKESFCFNNKQDKLKPIQVKKKIIVDADKVTKIVISVVVRGR